MTKTAKNKEVLDQLYNLVVKQASAPKPVATGVPGKEPDSGAISTKHDTVDQNAVGPEKLKPQDHEQKPSTDPAKPTGGKKAEDTTPAVETPKVAAEATTEVAAPNASVEKLGQELLAMLNKFANNPVATGIPSHDPKWQAVSTKHDTVDQNAVGPEKLNPQSHGQKPATDPSVPVAHAKSADAVDADKVASYELGKLWAELVIKKAQDEQIANIKEAGRRDFEILVANAAEQMKQADRKSTNTKVAAVTDQTEKRAEAEGAAAFQALYKQAQFEQGVAQIIEQNKQLQAKLAEVAEAQKAKEAELNAKLAAQQATIEKAAAEDREQQKFANLAAVLEERIFSRFKSELAPTR